MMPRYYRAEKMSTLPFSCYGNTRARDASVDNDINDITNCLSQAKPTQDMIHIVKKKVENVEEKPCLLTSNLLYVC